MKKYYQENSIKIECKINKSEKCVCLNYLGLEMDATNTKFLDCSFDVVIDKGTLDALLVNFISYNLKSFSVGKITKLYINSLEKWQGEVPKKQKVIE